MDLVQTIYAVTSKLPKEEIYGLSAQMRRSAVSIPSNIAEGYKRKGIGEFLQFLSIADASAAELETQTLIGKGLYSDIDFDKALLLLDEVQKMLVGMVKKLNAKRSTLNATPVVASKNSTSKVYHFPWCPSASKIADKNKLTFATEAAAISAGYTLAGNCVR